MMTGIIDAARDFSTEELADAWNVDAGGVYDRLEGYRALSVRDAAAVALLCRRPLSIFV